MKSAVNEDRLGGDQGGVVQRRQEAPPVLALPLQPTASSHSFHNSLEQAAACSAALCTPLTSRGRPVVAVAAPVRFHRLLVVGLLHTLVVKLQPLLAIGPAGGRTRHTVTTVRRARAGGAGSGAGALQGGKRGRSGAACVFQARAEGRSLPTLPEDAPQQGRPHERTSALHALTSIPVPSMHAAKARHHRPPPSPDVRVVVPPVHAPRVHHHRQQLVPVALAAVCTGQDVTRRQHTFGRLGVVCVEEALDEAMLHWSSICFWRPRAWRVPTTSLWSPP